MATLQADTRRDLLLRLAVRGLSATEAAEEMDLPVHPTRETFRDPSFMAEVTKMQGEALSTMDEAYVEKQRSLLESIEGAGEEAFTYLLEVLRDEEAPPSLRVRIAHDLLDRNAESSRQPGSQQTHQFSTEELMVAAQTASDMNVISIDSKGA